MDEHLRPESRGASVRPGFEQILNVQPALRAPDEKQGDSISMRRLLPITSERNQIRSGHE